MTIQEVYDQYKIPPFLQMHQYRVAAVAKMMCDHGFDKVPAGQIIKTCLVHDMGNIIKFDMDVFYESWDPEGTAYWGEVKDDFKRRYGGDESRATLQIIEELELGPDVRGAVRVSGFTNAANALEQKNWASMMLIYCDMRALPRGIWDLDERIKDLQERYRYHISSTMPKDPEVFKTNRKALDKIEGELFHFVDKLKPKHITEEAVQEIIPDLRNYVIR